MVSRKSSTDPASPRRSDVVVKGKSGRRYVRVALLGGLALTLALTASARLAVTAFTLKSELEAASDLLPRLKGDIGRGDGESAERTLEQLRAHTAAAQAAGSDPFWTAGHVIPWLGGNFEAASEIATAADDVVQLGATPLVGAFQSLEWKSLIPNENGVNLGTLASASPKLNAASHAVRQSSERLNAIDVEQLLPQIAEPLALARGQLTSIRGGLEAAASAASITPDMLGLESPRRYLLLIQNNAELRASGGIPGAVAVLNVDEGKLTLQSQTSAGSLGAVSPPIAADPEQQLIYSNRLGTYMQDVNLTPDFPTAARLAQRMWEMKRGETLDGVISIDPVALGYVLDSTGPVHLNDLHALEIAAVGLPSELTGKNVVPTLLSDVYSKIPEPRLQDAYFAGVAKETFEALAAGRSDPKKLLEGLSRGVDEGRVLVWSGDADEQRVIEHYPLSGGISGTSITPAQFGVYFNDGTGAKMDYYVERTVQLIEQCTANEYSQFKVRVSSTNTAPQDAATSLPEYVTGAGVFGVPAGSVQTNIIAYGPVQSNVETAFVADKKAGFASHRHDGRPVGSVTVRLAPGQSSTVEFTFGKIVQHTEPELSVTPTVQALKDVVLDTIPAKCVPAA